jgi:hypothetical protein
MFFFVFEVVYSTIFTGGCLVYVCVVCWWLVILGLFGMFGDRCLNKVFGEWAYVGPGVWISLVGRGVCCLCGAPASVVSGTKHGSVIC